MAITQSEALKRVQTLDQIPTLPEVMTRILGALDDDTTCVDDVTEILAADPVITARILRLANSPFFGARFEVDSIHRAVVTVGFEAVKQLALATTVLDSLASKHQLALDPEDFWLHALGSAKAAQLLAFSTRQITMPESCFTSGLLHDLGKYVLALSLGEEYRTVIEEAAEREEPLVVTEQRNLRTDYREVGSWLAGHWSFPEVIVASVQYGGQPDRYQGPYQKEVFIVSIASDMARMAEFGHGGDSTPPTLREDWIATLGLQADQVLEICEALAGMKDDGRALLGVLREA